MASSGKDSTSVDIQQIKSAQSEGNALIIDVRSREEFKNGHLVEADLNYDYNSGEFAEKYHQLDKSKTYYLHCRSGARSGKAAAMMRKNGYKAHNIGGYEELVQAGFTSKNG